MPRLWNLKARRRAALLSLRDLAERSGVARRQIVEREAGRASAQPRTVLRLAKALRIRPRFLLGTRGRPEGRENAPGLSEQDERELRRGTQEALGPLDLDYEEAETEDRVGNRQ